MKVIHAYEKGNSQAGLLVKKLQISGHQVESYEMDVPVSKERITASLPAEVIHLHNSSFVAAHLTDVYVETNNRIATFIHYETSDLRTEKDAIRFNPYAKLGLTFQDAHVTNNLNLLSPLYPACIVKDVEAVAYAAKVHNRVYVVPHAIDLDAITILPSTKGSNSLPLILHLLTNDSKGTDYIEEVIDRLQKEGYQFEYRRIENTSHEDALRQMQQGDIIIDHLLRGSYGVVSIEAMALGKPAISYIREDLKSRYDPSLPVISANPATLYQKLIPLIKDAELRVRIGKAGREYVEQHHHVSAVINKLVEAYRAEIEYLLNPPQSEQPTIVDTITGNTLVNGENRTIEHDTMTRATQTRHLQPNRYYTRKRAKNRSNSYFSFNMAEIPLSATITKAVIVLPVMLNKKQIVSVVRIKRDWNSKKAKRKLPIVFPRQFGKLSTLNRTSVLHWDCTELVRRWHRNGLKNHGIRISRKLRTHPELMITIDE
ncbi:hypothetical protein Back11_63560 [Paenibacillus baekrokdamisoli]|uniref:Glycosyl transferase family 1 domain-containing protein n=1 Tax=Paenibacillus baekrokdamisoli TaxID=1712516 RepID=A0A3G9JGI2_9BACL|nr:DNRLRE domain-containing protein [Paenibacillus baekrokdamisoli]MBB3069415.1 hypothetical protein [Paenibacillus baekrokdamisoli]BBH25011.1 hypothetical protein Back11_63560 [Paenibacillus baekrokdamisoli]